MRNIFLIIGLFVTKIVMANGFSPDLSINKKVGDKFRLNLKIESFFTDIQQNGDFFEKYHDGTDMQIFISRKQNPFQSFALGYQIGIEQNDKNTHRTIQQFAQVQYFQQYKIGHRIRTDQTFYHNKSNKYRLRYRLSAEFPLQGQTIDTGEFYMVSSNEFIGTIQNESFEYENRFVANLGYYFINKSKIQTGFDFRTDFSETNLWFKLGFYLNV